jgi:hypothetical protein
MLSGYSFLAGALALVRKSPGSARLSETARRAGIAAFAVVFLAAVVLVVAAFQNDFSIAYIFHHSNRDLPAPYKFATLWSGQEGSLLFWSLLLAAYGLVLRLRYKTDPRLFAYASVIIAAVQVFFLLVLNVGFCFDRTFTPLGAYHFESASMVRLQDLPFVRSLPVPLPYPWLQGLDMMKSQEQDGSTFGNIYLLGKLGDVHDPSFHGFKSYYAVALFFKEPIALQILFLMGMAWVWKNRRLDEFVLGEALLAVAAGALFVWLSFFSRAQIGIRHILPVFAVDVIVAGAAFAGFRSMLLRRRVVLGLLVVWLGISVASYYPNMIPYMNEWVLDRKLAYKVLADSNLDWGQNSAAVEAFLKKNPDVIENPKVPTSGRILVDANHLVGVAQQPGDPLDGMRWLRSRYKPVAEVGYADFLFLVPASDLAAQTLRRR